MSNTIRNMEKKQEKEKLKTQKEVEKQRYLAEIRKDQRECETIWGRVQVNAMALLDLENGRPVKKYEEYLTIYQKKERHNLANWLSAREILMELETRLRLNQIAFASEVKKNRVGLCCQDGEKVRQLVWELDRLGLRIMEVEEKEESKQNDTSKEELKGRENE